MQRYVRGVSGKGLPGLGEFDFKVGDPFNNNLYVLSDYTLCLSSEFGNYVAGFGAYYHFGPFGTDGVSLAGRLYAWVGGNDEGNDGSGYWIGKGIEDAQAERADYWKDFIESFPRGNEPWRFH